MSNLQTVRWPVFKSIIDSANIPVDYRWIQTDDYYFIFNDGPIQFLVQLPRDGGDDVTAFETSYKTAAVNFFYTEMNAYRNLTGNATTTVKTGPGLFRGITINDNTTCGTVTIYDNTSASGQKIMTLQIGSPSGGLLSTSGQPGPVQLSCLDVRFSTGLTIVTAGSLSNNITVFFR